jgi:hypothetical protein
MDFSFYCSKGSATSKRFLISQTKRKPGRPDPGFLQQRLRVLQTLTEYHNYMIMSNSIALLSYGRAAKDAGRT